MVDKGLYSRAHKAIIDLLPSLKGETLTREQWWRLVGININNPRHIPFKNAINEVLYQMSIVNKNKQIQKNGSGFLVVDDDIVKIAIGANNLSGRVDLVLPFGIHQYCFMYDKNIGVVYGSKDSGKTAIMLNIARLNMNKHKVIYFSSEMGQDELNGRLKKYEGLELSDWKIEAYERSYNFDQVMKGPALYLIDFLELGGDEQEYYKGVALVRRIYDRLREIGGVAFIACQKNRDAYLPKGGSGLLEKARIALSLDPGRIELTVAKNWADGVVSSPRGKIWTYQLVGGINIVNPLESF